MKIGTIAVSAIAIMGTALLPIEPVEAAGGRSKQSVHKASAQRGAASERRNVRSTGGNRKASTSRDRNRSSNSVNRASNNRGGNNVVAGNTVVVNKNVDRGYHHHGYDNDYHNGWDDDDDGFFEVMGKAAAVTAGVGLTAAVIGEIFEDEPDDCQQTVSNGQTYLYCNGVWYQPTMSGSNVQYIVVNDPN